MQYGSVMRGYLSVPGELLADPAELAPGFDEVWDWIVSGKDEIRPGMADVSASLKDLYGLYRALRKARSKRGAIDFENRPLPEVGWPDHSFDRIFSICVLEHIPEHREILATCTRLLKPGGEMIFSVDTLATITDEALRESHRTQHHVVQYYTPEGLREILEESGFVDIEIRSLFRSDYARLLFERGIRQGFNFGRVGASQLSRRLDEAESLVAADAPGIFLAASARTPGATG